jgi:hypothetical protein
VACPAACWPRRLRLTPTRCKVAFCRQSDAAVDAARQGRSDRRPGRCRVIAFRRIRSSRRPGSRDRVAAEAIALERRGRYASDQPDPDNRTLQMGRQAKDPRAVQQEVCAGPPRGQRMAERFLARWETHPTQPGSSFVTLTQAVSSAPPGRSVAARNSSPNASCQATPKATARQPHVPPRSVLTMARDRQDTSAESAPAAAGSLLEPVLGARSGRESHRIGE